MVPVVAEVVPVVASVAVVAPVVASAAVVVPVVVLVVASVAVVVPVVVQEAVPAVVQEVVPVEVLVEVLKVVPRLLLSHTSTTVSTLPEVRKIFWLPRTWLQVSPSTVKRESPLRSHPRRTVSHQPRSSTVFGTHSDLSWPLVSWVV